MQVLLQAGAWREQCRWGLLSPSVPVHFVTGKAACRNVWVSSSAKSAGQWP